MTEREEIIRMARKAGLYEDGQFFVCKADELGRFAALVAAAEREVCAKVCEEFVMGSPFAAAIRARGKE